jgi:hypothetical protein
LLYVDSKNNMKRILLLASVLLTSKIGLCQIKFDISKMKKIEMDKLVKENSPNTMYLEMKYGGYELSDHVDIKKIENKIITKIQYVYTDYPKDFDYSELNFQRFAALYVILPTVFNKPWIQWEIIKQTKCSSSYEASTMFHGYVITFKDGPEPNKTFAIPPEILKKLADISSTVEIIDIKSTDEVAKFLSSKEIKINDIKYPNKNNSIKFFKQKDPGEFSIISGLFLTTGMPLNAIGPNDSPSISAVNGNMPTPDKNLSSLVNNANSLLFDASIIEFDIQIDADSLVFQYAFASEEFPEFLQFNDVFGLFISGPGLNNNPKDTTLNLATLPDRKTPISVSSINHLKNKEFYIANDYNLDLKLFKTWQYDGFTKLLTAKVKLKPKQKYHIKFAIADYGDPFYDSAVFIDALGVKTK